MSFQIGDRVLGCWKAINADRAVRGWAGEVREVLPGGKLRVAFPPYGKNEEVRVVELQHIRRMHD